MRVNIYAEEMTDRIEIIGKEIEGHTYTGLRLYLELPITLPDGSQAAGPFMHRPGDDDSAAITFWGKRDLRAVLRKMLAALDEHYGDAGALTASGNLITDAGMRMLKEAWPAAQAQMRLAAGSAPAADAAQCWCETCRPITMDDMRMVLCPTCGNKRCPHATDHRNACTGSNEPGQKGSAYEHCGKPGGAATPTDDLPPLLDKMPVSVYQHHVLGELYDRMAVHQYAVSYGEATLRHHGLFGLSGHRSRQDAVCAASRPDTQDDTARLDFLDSLNAALNAQYGTTYRWKLVLSPNVVRLMAGQGGNGHVAAVDLHDSNANGLPSCRQAIDEARTKGANHG